MGGCLRASSVADDLFDDNSEAPVTKSQIRKIRGEIDRTDFALLLGTSPVTVWRWEKGKAAPEGAALTLLELFRDHRRETMRLLWKCAEKRLARIKKNVT